MCSDYTRILPKYTHLCRRLSPESWRPYIRSNPKKFDCLEWYEDWIYSLLWCFILRVYLYDLSIKFDVRGLFKIVKNLRNQWKSINVMYKIYGRWTEPSNVFRKYKHKHISHISLNENALCQLCALKSGRRAEWHKLICLPIKIHKQYKHNAPTSRHNMTRNTSTQFYGIFFIPYRGQRTKMAIILHIQYTLYNAMYISPRNTI